MKIFVQTIYFPPRLGGIENHAYYLCRGLARRGHEVRVVTSRTEPESAVREREGNMTIRRVFLPNRSPLGWTVNAAASFPAALREGWGAEMLHAHTFQSVPPVLPVRWLRRTPLVVTIHSSHFLRMVKKAHWRVVFRAMLRSADLILATSDELADACRLVAPGKRIEPVVNGIDTELFRPVEPSLERGEGRRILVTTRRLVKKNGVRYLIDAMPAILEKNDCDLYLAGIGPEREDLDRRVAGHGIGERVHFLGGVPNRELPALLSSADAVVIPSLVEATSLSALEAMSCERPMAVSRVGGLPEIIDESCGVLFRSGDPADLAEKVNGLLARPEEERRALGREGRRRVAGKWSIDALVERHEAFFREVLEGKNIHG
ncbi:MAG: glycosyltransferase family 4 protein [Candidatus Eisenbacteria bacterium]|nr:glycosyltransferase family 4 protein [Candidatus Eisenbacteria bacterium]